MKKSSLLFIILAGILWSTVGIFVRYLSQCGLNSIQLTLVRSSVAFLYLAVFALIKNRSLFKIAPNQLLLYAGIGFTLFTTAASYFFAMQATSVATAVVLMYMAPVYVMLFSVLFWKERFTMLQLLSLVLMLAGVSLVSGFWGGFKLDLMGILAGIFSGFSYAAYTILTKIAMQRKYHPISVTLYGFLGMAMISLCFANPVQIVRSIAAFPEICLPLALSFGFFTMVLPFGLYTVAVRDLPAGIASVLSITDPVSSTMISVLLFKESIDWLQVGGIALILWAVLVLSVSRKQLKKSVDLE